MYWGWVTTSILITMQVLFGALIIFTGLNLWIAILHAFFITCYFGNLSYFILLSSRSAKADSNAVHIQPSPPSSSNKFEHRSGTYGKIISKPTLNLTIYTVRIILIIYNNDAV